MPSISMGRVHLRVVYAHRMVRCVVHDRGMADVIAERDRKLAAVLELLGQAAEQKAAWSEEVESLVRQARALGASQEEIAPHAQVHQSTVSRMLARTDPVGNDSADVGRASAET